MLFLVDSGVLSVVLQNGAGDGLAPRRIGDEEDASIGHPVRAGEERIDFPHEVRGIPPAIARTHRYLGHTAAAAENREHGEPAELWDRLIPQSGPDRNGRAIF